MIIRIKQEILLQKVNYEDLMKNNITINGKKVEVSSMSSYNKALEIAEILKDEIKRGEFPLRSSRTRDFLCSRE